MTTPTSFETIDVLSVEESRALFERRSQEWLGMDRVGFLDALGRPARRAAHGFLGVSAAKRLALMLRESDQVLEVAVIGGAKGRQVSPANVTIRVQV